MRVAIVGDYPINQDKISGGVEYVVYSLSQELAKLPDVEVHVLTLRTDRNPEIVSYPDKVIVHYLKPNYKFANLTRNMVNVRKLKKELLKINPDVVHAQIAGMNGEAARKSGLPFVLTPHGVRFREPTPGKSMVEKYIRQPIIQSGERNSIRSAPFIVSISPYISEEFGSDIRGHDELIENPVNEIFFEVPDNRKENVVLFAGYLEERKSVHLLIEAFRGIVKEIPDAKLKLLGRARLAEYGDYLQKMVKEYGISDSVEFAGLVGEEGVAKALSECSVLVLPSRQETAPTIIQQAMAAGRPVVATRVGGIPFLVENNRTGILVEYGDLVELKNAICKVLEDKNLAASLGDAGKDAALARFQVKDVASKTFALYQKAIAQAKRSSK